MVGDPPGGVLWAGDPPGSGKGAGHKAVLGAGGCGSYLDR